jgi:starch phosphorylase
MEIIYDINDQFLMEVEARWPGDAKHRNRMSLIEEGPEQYVRMSHLAIVGSFSVNGVAALHTELLKKGLFKDFNKLWPQKFNNKTNGVTQRRWLAHCNPELGELISGSIGDAWVRDLEQLSGLREFQHDRAFGERWHGIKQANKQRLAAFVERETGICFDPGSIFDVQVKRIHEYKRQLLNVLHVIHLYERILSGDTDGLHPRCVLIGGRAAPGYQMAKLIIKLINNVARVINADPAAGSLLKLVFIPNYQVTAMEQICPGTDLSEQISVAGKEASGTGNMKFMLNGALTIGTLDGANIEIRDRVGAENFFLFGLDAEGAKSAQKHYDPNGIIAADEDLRRVMELLEFGHFNPGEPGIFNPISASIRSPHDPWLTAADFHSYVEAQQRVNAAYADVEYWTRMSILNTAASGWFSSDRTIRQYAEEIWSLPLERAPGAG